MGGDARRRRSRGARGRGRGRAAVPGADVLDGADAPVCKAGGRVHCLAQRPCELRKDEYFMMGDNRLGSCDSRTWGPVARSAFIGPVVATYWPPTRWTVR